MLKNVLKVLIYPYNPILRVSCKYLKFLPNNNDLSQTAGRKKKKITVSSPTQAKLGRGEK